MKKTFKILAVSALLVGSMFVVGCNGKQPLKIDTVTNFQINNETGEFSFTGVEEAKTYYVRVYNHSEKDEEGKELALEDKVPVAARRIRFKSEVTEYSGELDFSNLVAGNDYDAYVYTYVKNDDGDLEFAYTEPSAFVFKTKYTTPTLKYKKATTNCGNTTYSDAYLVSSEVEEGNLKIILGDDFFAFNSGEYALRDPSYQINIFDLSGTKVDSKILTKDDVKTETTESTNQCGQTTISTSREAVAVFTGDYTLEDFMISIKIISTNSQAFYDSEESEAGVVGEVTSRPSQGGGQQGGGGPGGC